MTLAERFWAKVEKTDGCWIWTASTNGKGGYGQIGLGGRGAGNALAHRVAWLLTYGQWPSAQIDHTCRNHRCVNPAHLEDVPPVVNTRRGEAGRPWREQRCARGHDWTDPRNVYTRSNGRHACRACAREHDRERRRPR
jgi:hypothetical protein